MLKVENLSHSYGGLNVLDSVSFNIDAGEKVGLIGPNGSGKTTLLKILSGILRVKSGHVYFLGQDITKMPVYKRVSLGIGLSFQNNNLFPHLSLLDNVRLAIQGKESYHFQMLRSLGAYTDALAEARKMLNLVGLWAKRGDQVSALSYGEQRQVEIILALALNPELLLMDEPSAGLTTGESAELIQIINQLVREKTVLFCAHDMELVFALAQRVIVLYNGEIIASGTAKEIQTNPKVREIYLGI
jgi:branched-chain amino acid transport system ATP-binding protein